MRRGHRRPSDVTVVMSAPDPTADAAGEPDASLRKAGKPTCAATSGSWARRTASTVCCTPSTTTSTSSAATTATSRCWATATVSPSCEALSQRARHRPLGHVHRPRRPDEITHWLSSADLGVTPDPMCEFNDRSTMNKTLEYMAHGLPVIAFDLTETRRSAEACRRLT